VGFLTDVVAEIRAGLAAVPLDVDALRSEAAARPPAADLEAALRRAAPAVIAEVKRASPSAGTIADGADPAAVATAYARGGAAAISVLTEPRHFGGALGDLRAVRDAVALPLLRKDFLVDPSQLVEARAAGADSALLIAACLAPEGLDAMLATARDLGMEPLIETHGGDDLERALAAGARIVGVNARDLESLDVDVDGALERLRLVPPDRLAVLESGVATRAHVVAAFEAGASAILVGEALMRAADPAAALRALRGDEERAR
jgi:indole-3-glycerol phosphate synthase